MTQTDERVCVCQWRVYLSDQGFICAKLVTVTLPRRLTRQMTIPTIHFTYYCINIIYLQVFLVNIGLATLYAWVVCTGMRVRCKCVCVSVFLCLCMYIWMYLYFCSVCICMYLFVSASVSVYRCVCVRVFVCQCVHTLWCLFVCLCFSVGIRVTYSI